MGRVWKRCTRSTKKGLRRGGLERAMLRAVLPFLDVNPPCPLRTRPYRRQSRRPGMGFVAAVDARLAFGETTRTREQLAAVGSERVPDSTLRARLVAEVSSATATRGTPVTAILTEPLYSPTHQLI